MCESQAAAHLVTHGQLSAGDLSRLLDLTPSTITHLLGRLDRAGLATTTADPDDQRRSVVRPTPRAQHMVSEIRTWLDSCFDRFEHTAISLDTVLQVNELRLGLEDIRVDLRAQHATDAPSPTNVDRA